MVNNLQITSLAHQCPLVFGKAVYLARSLYSLFSEENTFDDEVICDGYYKKEHPFAVVEPLAEPQLTVFPSPASSQTLIVYYLPETIGAEAYVNVRSLEGRQLFTKQISARGSSITFNANELAIGLYIAELCSNNTIIKTTKFTVTH